MTKYLVYMGILLALAACSVPRTAAPSADTLTPTLSVPTPSATPLPLPTETATPTEVPTPLPSDTTTPTETPVLPATETATPTFSATPTVTPTYSVLRAKVLEQANCRYGPGAMYLYKYGLYPDFNIEVFGRSDRGDWVLIRAIGGTNPCWVKASLLEIKGDVMTLEPTTIPLPQSPYYGPVTGVAAVRNGNEVTISWNLFVHRAGDEPDLYTQLVETWLCQAGELVFTPIGTFENIITVIDEPGCAEASHGLVYGVEKHGYTYPVEIPWPAHEEP